MTLNHRSKKYMEMTPAQRKVYDMTKRPASTELQRLAQKENFALFQLKGMKGNAQHMMYDTFCPIPDAVLITIVNACERGIESIKADQYYREQARKELIKCSR